MSPVLPNSASAFSIRRRLASTPSASLFPECPEPHSPMTAAGELAPLPTGPSGERAQAGLAECPPPAGAAEIRLSRDAAGVSPSAKAPLVRIDRLAASFPA